MKDEMALPRMRATDRNAGEYGRVRTGTDNRAKNRAGAGPLTHTLAANRALGALSDKSDKSDYAAHAILRRRNSRRSPRLFCEAIWMNAAFCEESQRRSALNVLD